MVKTNQEEQRKAPILRFKGFTNDWEQRMVSDIGKIVGGGTPSTKNPKFWNGNINWFSPNEINIKRYVTESNKKITKEGLKKSSAKILPAKNTILFTSRATIGEMALLTIDSATNQGFQSFVLNNNVSRYFIFSLQNKIKKIALKKASGSTFLEISKKEVEKIKINIPSLKEQKKIANLFKLVDDYLALYERKANYYNCLFLNLKKIFFAKNKKTKSLIELIDIKTGYRNSEDNIEKGKYLFFDRSVEVKKLDEFDFDEEAIILPGEGQTFYPKYINDKYALHQRSYSLFNFKNIYPKYLYYFLTTQSNNFLKYSVGTTVPSLRKSTFKHINVPIKSMNTQIQYATILEKIEIIIDENLNKINSLKQIKKELLDTMFI
ncbi:restriction endonuclease subunit S [Ligilactobacillus cholophilus]|uniref:restriction endonuclease subunit S n=1 Tax=Ligilactobacillus cholophilus TaxID=3050131 RepID=UPI0025B246C3|nr:restriction endonuclease subunit S [Ligilactobacillus cholophilus]